MICTPGRLLQHMTENAEFATDNVQVVSFEHYGQTNLRLWLVLVLGNKDNSVEIHFSRCKNVMSIYI